MKKLLTEISACTVCSENLPLGPRPIISASNSSQILIIGQAPGTKVHASGIPWSDASGNRLREWLKIDTKTFYNAKRIAIMPMGFCYPGKGKSGDLPPRSECAPLWHNILLDQMKEIKLTLLIGQYAQKYYLQKKARLTLTETVRNFEEYLPNIIPLPHPSPRNNIWLKRNSWFEELLLPELRKKVKEVL